MTCENLASSSASTSARAHISERAPERGADAATRRAPWVFDPYELQSRRRQPLAYWQGLCCRPEDWSVSSPVQLRISHTSSLCCEFTRGVGRVACANIMNAPNRHGADLPRESIPTSPALTLSCALSQRLVCHPARPPTPSTLNPKPSRLGRVPAALCDASATRGGAIYRRTCGRLCPPVHGRTSRNDSGRSQADGPCVRG